MTVNYGRVLSMLDHRFLPTSPLKEHLTIEVPTLGST